MVGRFLSRQRNFILGMTLWASFLLVVSPALNGQQIQPGRTISVGNLTNCSTANSVLQGGTTPTCTTTPTVTTLTAGTSVVVGSVNLTTTSAILASAGGLTYGSRSVLSSAADGKFSLLNNAATSGVTLDFATDSTLKLFARDGTTPGILQIGGFTLQNSSSTIAAFSGPVNSGANVTVPAGSAYVFLARGVIQSPTAEAFQFSGNAGGTFRIDTTTTNVAAFQSGAGADTATIKAKTHLANAGTFANCNASPVEGMLCAITDSTTTTWGATITGGGANHVIGYYNGTNWTVFGK